MVTGLGVKECFVNRLRHHQHRISLVVVGQDPNVVHQDKHGITLIVPIDCIVHSENQDCVVSCTTHADIFRTLLTFIDFFNDEMHRLVSFFKIRFLLLVYRLNV